MLPSTFIYTVESSKFVFGELWLAVRLCLAENRLLISGDSSESACLGCICCVDYIAFVLKSLLHQHSSF